MKKKQKPIENLNFIQLTASDFPRFVFNSGCAFINTCPPVLN